MSDPAEHDVSPDVVWRTYLTTGRTPPGVEQPWFESPNLRRFIRMLPTDPRCHICMYPFQGVGGGFARRLLGIERSRMNPHMCNICERFAEAHPGGTEMVLSMLFVDVRGSTSMAEKMSSTEFSQLIDRFYRTATNVVFDHGGMLEKLAGDEVAAFFVPAFAGENHAQVAIEAAQQILRATGHVPGGEPWAPAGVGVHTGEVYIGSVGEKDKNLDITMLGDNVNTTARLVSAAGIGELVVSDDAVRAAGIPTQGLELQSLELKGKEQLFDAWRYDALSS